MHPPEPAIVGSAVDILLDHSDGSAEVVLQLPWCPRGDLHRLLRTEASESDIMVRIMQGVSDGVAHLHDAGLAHRDLKPQNILLDSESNPLIADFGLSRYFSREIDMIAPPTNMVITLMYRDIALMLCGDFVVSDHNPFAADVWSLGCILSEVLHPHRERVFAHHSEDHVITESRVQAEIFHVIGRPSKAEVTAIYGPYAQGFREKDWSVAKRMTPDDFHRRQLGGGIFDDDVMKPLCDLLMDIFVLNPANRPCATTVSDRLGHAMGGGGGIAPPPPPPSPLKHKLPDAASDSFGILIISLCKLWCSLEFAYWDSGQWLHRHERAPPPHSMKPESHVAVASRTKALLKAFRSMMQAEGCPLRETAEAVVGSRPWPLGLEEMAAFTVAMQCRSSRFIETWRTKEEGCRDEVDEFWSIMHDYLGGGGAELQHDRLRRKEQHADLTVLMLNLLGNREPWASCFADAFFGAHEAAAPSAAAVHEACRQAVARCA